MQKIVMTLLAALLPGFFMSAPAQEAFPDTTPIFALTENSAETGKDPTERSSPVRLAQKIVALDHPVYTILDYYEASGDLGFLPMTKPFRKGEILSLLERLLPLPHLSSRDKEVITGYLADFREETTGVKILSEASRNSYALVGFGAQIDSHHGAGENGVSSYALTPKPYLSADLGSHISLHASMGPSIEKLAPDLFFGSFTRNGEVHFPNLWTGVSFLPYRTDYESLYSHTLIKEKWTGHSPFLHQWSVGFFYFTELSGSWFDDKLQVGLHNQRRAWGHTNENLLLSSTARRFPALEAYFHPASWLRFSWLTGSLFHPGGYSSSEAAAIYGYDTGVSHNLLTLQLLEIIPARWLHLSASSVNLWVKRPEPAYLMPFVFAHWPELEVGDYDNGGMTLDVALLFPRTGKLWFSFYNDEFSFQRSGALLRMPRNRYGWQAGWKTALPARLLPGTLSTLRYTRLTPFIYTHYPETRVHAFMDRPVDMTYTHDGANLGFYLPPNSGEWHWNLTNTAFPNLVLALDTRLITHGTNDLASYNLYQIYGDIYRHQFIPEGGDLQNYPLTRFGRDGIYDRTFMTEFRFDRKVTMTSIVPYFRVAGSVGMARTRWESNDSGVTAPAPVNSFSGRLSLIVDIL